MSAREARWAKAMEIEAEGYAIGRCPRCRRPYHDGPRHWPRCKALMLKLAALVQAAR